eukprot:TRINITY_DN1649_c0_g1_i16.p1 TRINITY_DN1649_c0_g1~~TRINITY_DN1649_c0_g1_i16.p1  ORF type:complete len:196 (+),score=29.96 TRINITY_DN1649_c0_g1_i16:371-958(+)
MYGITILFLSLPFHANPMQPEPDVQFSQLTRIFEGSFEQLDLKDAPHDSLECARPVAKDITNLFESTFQRMNNVNPMSAIAILREIMDWQNTHGDFMNCYLRSQDSRLVAEKLGIIGWKTIDIQGRSAKNVMWHFGEILDLGKKLKTEYEAGNFENVGRNYAKILLILNEKGFPKRFFIQRSRALSCLGNIPLFA